jgi:hypothetical protein
MTTSHDTIRVKIDSAWARLLAAIGGLDDTALTTGVTGAWSVKDILGHITAWEDATMLLSQHQIAGTTPPNWNDDEPWDMDAFNARESAARAELPLTEIFRLLNETHGCLLEWLPTIPDEHLVKGSDVEERLRQDTWDHYPEHTAAITAWRASRG